MKRHDPSEIVAKLRQADEMLKRGQSQKDVCKALGVSVMTFHRWRKMPARGDYNDSQSLTEFGVSDGAQAELVDLGDSQVGDLKLENQRLRRIVSDLLLEKMKVQEALEKARK